MNTIKRILAKMLIIAILITSIISPTGTASAKNNNTNNKKTVKKARILVKYKDDSSSNEVKEKVKDSQNLQLLSTKKKMTRSKIEILEVDASTNVKATIDALKKDSNVLYAQPDFVLSSLDTIVALATTNDITEPKFNEQWGLENIGQSINLTAGTTDIDIDAIKAWETTTGNASVLVGILDEGIDTTHQDLEKSIYKNTNEIDGNGFDDDGNGYIDDITGWDFANSDKTVYDAVEDEEHGTHIAGIIAAQRNEEGIIGIAPNIKIVPLKFMSNGTGYTSDVIEAIEYAKKLGVQIINCSFGSTDENPALKDAIAASDILFVCAAGNDAKNTSQAPIYPACYDLPNIISVAAVDNKGQLASFSNYGSKIQVAAPGVNILSTTPSNKYGYLSGTSMAAPFISGIAALLKSSYPDMTSQDITNRISKTVKPVEALETKVSSSGIANAYNALSYTLGNTETEENTEETENSTEETENSKDTSDVMLIGLAASVSPQLMEMIHYGENGVSPSTGNYSSSFTDITMSAPGFQINISRTYNSKDDRTTSTMGRGWTFGFEGSLKQDTTNTTLWVAKLPNGSAQVFIKNTDGTFTANDSRSKLQKNTDNTYTLTTKDQYTYGFNTNGYLYYMKDKYQNAVNIEVDAAGKISKINDQVGRSFEISYNTKGMISQIKDPMGRKISYTYSSTDLLEKVEDPMGNTWKYQYDEQKYLKSIIDRQESQTESIVYDHAAGANQHKVTQHENALGKINTYTYDTTNKKTTITDQNNNTIEKSYDTAYYITKSKDPEGKETTVEYYLDTNNFNKYGEEKYITDRNGNKTEYQRDNNGNITKQINPDGSFKEYQYDDKNNLTMEKDEYARVTRYIYDENKIKLLKIVNPLNGIDEYSETVDQNKFAIKTYTYYSQAEAQSMGCEALGILKTETDPEGGIAKYTYDQYGNKKSIEDSQGNITTNKYNTLGWLISTTTPNGNTTKFTFDQNGNLEKTTLAGGETKRTIYDKEGRKTKEILPNEYDPNQDGLSFSVPEHSYAANIGYRYTYYPSGLLQAVTDPENNTTTYTYDIYGNTLTETKPNNSQYIHTYDQMNRLTKTEFKNTNQGEEAQNQAITLAEYKYEILEDGKRKETDTKHLNNTEKASTITIYDFADRIVEAINPNGGKTSYTYNPNGTIKTFTAINGGTTNYKYDGLNRASEIWSQLEPSLYSYKKIEYDKAGRIVQEKIGKDKLNLYETPAEDRIITKTNQYYTTGTLKSTTTSYGYKAQYEYDMEKNMTKETVYDTENTYQITEYTYNHIQKPTQKKTYTNSGDIYDSHLEEEAQIELITSYQYDKNGNIKKVTAPNGVATTYTYDKLDRQTTISSPGQDEYGMPALIAKTTTYEWNGQPKTTTDENGNTTNYTYNQRGDLEKITKNVTIEGTTKETVSLYQYDRAGRKIAEVSPNNYIEDAPINTLNHSEYTYDLMGRIKTIAEIYKENPQDETLKRLVTKAYKYDQSGNLTKELDGEGFNSGVGTTDDQKIHTGYGIERTYNLSGNLNTETDPVVKQKYTGYSTKHEYDALGRKIAITNAKGTITCYYYNDAGNLTATTIKKSSSEAEQTLSQADYDQLGRIKTKTDSYGNKTQYEYNKLGQLRKVIHPGDETMPTNTIKYKYDAIGQLKSKADTFGTIELYTYDKQGRQTQLTQKGIDGKLVKAQSIKYDMKGNPRFKTDANGTTTETIYDELDRIIKTKIEVTNVTGQKTEQTTTNNYDKNGNLLTITDRLGNSITNTYDALNRLIEKRDAYGVAIEKYQYNKNHAQTKSIDALGRETIYNYNRNNALTQTTNPKGSTMAQNYDELGNITIKTDGNGNVTRYEYDYLNRLTTVTNAMGEKTAYTYDLEGNMLTQTDGNGHTTTFEYNAMNKLTKRIDHGGRTGSIGSYEYDNTKVESYTYNENGTILATTDRKGNTITYQYDQLGRQTLKDAGDEKIRSTYDNNGNPLTIKNSTGTVSRSYDELGRVIVKNMPQTGVVTYQYDITEDITAGHSKEISKDLNGNPTTKEYDKMGRLKSITDDNMTTTYNYYPNGSTLSVIYPDGSREDYTYYADNTLKTLVNKKADGTVLESYSYTYDKAGNQTSKTDAKGTTYYVYDPLNRIKSINEPSGKTTYYMYDKAGNRTTENISAPDKSAWTSYTYNEQNRLITTETEEGSIKTVIRYSYDNNGNMILKTKETTKPIEIMATPTPAANFGMFISGQKNGYTEHAKEMFMSTASFKYNALNEMIKTTSGDNDAIYKYSGEGYRITKIQNEKTDQETIVHYFYEYDKVILETDDKGNQIAKNIYGNNLISRTITEGGDKETLYYMYNGHADVTALLDATTGDIKATYYYDAFGTIVEETNGTLPEGEKVDNPFRYSGYQYDEETELYYLNARMYDSKIARFMQEDTYRGKANDPLSLNLYTYCSNNPLIYWDYTGHWQQGDEKLNAEDQAKIVALGNAWNAAKTQLEKNKIHEKAEDIRNVAKNNTNYSKDKDTLVKIKNLEEFDKAMVNAMKDGKITKEEDAAAQKLIGAKVSTTYSVSEPETDIKLTTTMTTTTIGKSDIGVETKLAQSKKDTNLVSAGIKVKTTTHYSAYIFYLPEWKNEMLDDRKRIADNYGISEDDVGTASVSSSRELKDSWNSIGTTDEGKNVSAVVIDTHANNSVLGFGNGNTMSSSDISNLDNKNIDKLILYGCNAGHLDNKENNPASSFAKKVNSGLVLASDGTVKNGVPRILWLFGAYAYKSVNDKSFMKQRKSGSTRDNEGWIIYEYKDGKITTSDSLGKKLTLTQMIEKIK